MKTEADIKAQRIAVAGKEIAEYYHHLWREIARVHIHWKELSKIYGQGPEVVDLVNSIAKDYFKMVTSAQWKDIIMSLAAFSDSVGMKSKTRRVSNVSLLALIELDVRLKTEFTKDLKHLKEAMIPIRFMRDKMIAHWDAVIWLNPGSPVVDAAQIRRCLGLSINLMKKIARYYNFSFWDFTHQDGFHHGTDTLLYHLRQTQKVNPSSIKSTVRRR